MQVNLSTANGHDEKNHFPTFSIGRCLGVIHRFGRDQMTLTGTANGKAAAGTTALKRRCASCARASRRLLCMAFAVALLASSPADSGILSDDDFKKVEQIKPLFLNLMGDLVQTSQRPDLAGGDSECIKATIQELLQMSQELSSYEYLITIEREMTDFGENSPMRDVIKFAIEKSNTILANERKRLAQLSDQCIRFPLSQSKTQRALQVIDTTNGILNSIRF